MKCSRMAYDQSLHSPNNPHFFQPLLPGFHTHLNIPVAFFLKHVQGLSNDHIKTAKLTTDASTKTWLVKVDGVRLTDGWEDFAVGHDLRIGDITIFRHEGEMVFHVTAFGPSCCDIQYTSASSHNISDDSQDQTNNTDFFFNCTGNSSGERRKRVKKNPRTKEDSSSDHSQFVAHVSPSSLSSDRLYIPTGFARSNGLNNMSGKQIIVLLNEEGRSWNLNMTYNKVGMQTFVRPGWRRFCAENGMKKGHQYTFKLVRKSAPPVIRLSRAEHESKLAPESSLHHSYFMGSVSSNSLTTDKLYLQRQFVTTNGLEKGLSEITLKNEWGGSWILGLRHCEPHNHTYLGPGWKTFCQANGIKAEDSFMLKLVGTGDTPVLLLCSSNRGKTPLECSEDRDDSIEDEDSSRQCIVMEKEKNSLRCIYDVESRRDDAEITGNSSGEKRKRVKKNPRTKEESSSDHSHFVAHVSPSSLSCDRLYLQMKFVAANGLKKGFSEIILKNEWGGRWSVGLRHYASSNRTYLGPGWKTFCQVNGIKAEDSFMFKLVETGDKPVLLLCTSNRGKTPLECSEDKESQESEEESLEDDSSSKDCVEMEKRKRSLRCKYPSSYSKHLTENSSGEKRKRVKKKPRRKEESSSDHSHFMAHVSPSSLRFDRLYVPISFSRSNGLDNMSGKEIVLLNQEGRSWNLNITYTKASVQTLVGPGWRRFCAENGMNQGHHYTFKLVGKSAPPVIRLSLAEPAPEPSLHHSYYVGSVSSNSLRTDKLYIQRKFVNENGLKGLSEIILKSECGGRWSLGLRYYKSLDHTYLGPGWKTFCQVNGIKTGDSFMFKVVETGDKPVLLLCSYNHGKTPLECSEESDDVNSLSSDTSSGESQESEEENFEDEGSSEESFEMVKRENSSRCRASSSYSQDRFVKLTLTPRALKTYKLMLPLGFTRVNGINKPGKITLLDKDGVKKQVVDLLDQNRNIGIMRLGKGWREFCDAHGVKVGQSFLLELIWEDEEANPVLKFCTKL
ncbi:unnamed protein product [Brassica napus]|uniref:(rape) hypothetical protein n=1 Tax=Brassica napus TaxID=3708 RepID=A0A816LCQ9_BRANA|nr:unnamed protein product [Brassica napus]